MDKQLAATIVSLAFGFVGTVLGCWTFFWNRKQKSLDGLSKILSEYVSGLRQLTSANSARRSSEALRFSFPDGGKGGEAVRAANELVGQYDSLITEALETVRRMETEVAANAFRFPTAIVKELSSATMDLFRLGELVNRGFWDAADVQAGSVRDRYQTIVRLARGWRLRNPFKTMIEGGESRVQDKIKKQNVASQDNFLIPEPRMKMIMDLIGKRMTSESRRSFAVHPPQKLIDNPRLIEGDVNIDELRDLEFKVAFQDGETQTLAFHELMFLTHELIFLAIQMQEIQEKLVKGGFDEVSVQIKNTIAPRDIMQPATVRVLLGKLEFSPAPAEVI